jgi:hypothetical protein
LFFTQSIAAVHDSSQSGAPLQSRTQSPPVQLVILQLWAPLHVSWQSPPPAQSMVHAPLEHVSTQSPPAHCIAHEAEPVHVWWQSPPGQFTEQDAPDAQLYWQSPLPAQLSLQEAPAGHEHVPPPPVHAKPCVPVPLPIDEELPPQLATHATKTRKKPA